MAEMSDAEVGRIDLAIVAYRDEGEWTLAELPEQVLDSVATIVAELRRYPGETGTLAFLAVDEDFALVIRVLGSTTREAVDADCGRHRPHATLDNPAGRVRAGPARSRGRYTRASSDRRCRERKDRTVGNFRKKRMKSS